MIDAASASTCSESSSRTFAGIAIRSIATRWRVLEPDEAVISNLRGCVAPPGAGPIPYPQQPARAATLVGVGSASRPPRPARPRPRLRLKECSNRRRAQMTVLIEPVGQVIAVVAARSDVDGTRRSRRSRSDRCGSARPRRGPGGRSPSRPRRAYRRAAAPTPDPRRGRRGRRSPAIPRDRPAIMSGGPSTSSTHEEASTRGVRDQPKPGPRNGEHLRTLATAGAVAQHTL